jgi:RNA polymerase sigma factor (sigma-70 family)
MQKEDADRARREETSRLIERYQGGSREAGACLVRLHEPLIRIIAESFRKRGSRDWLDVLQEGRIGLLLGATRHDSTKTYDGNPMPYLAMYIRGSIARWVRVRGEVVRSPSRKANPWRPKTKLFCEIPDVFHEDMEHSFEEVLVDDDPIADECFDSEQREENARVVARWFLKQLPLPHRKLLKRRFYDDATLEEAGIAIDVIRERARQIIMKAERYARRCFGHEGPFEMWLARAARFVRERRGEKMIDADERNRLSQQARRIARAK